MSVKINELTVENVKRIRAVQLEPVASGLTIIGGKNGQGKSSVLDAIAWALGGDRMRPSMPEREGSVTPPNINIKLSNGLVVLRSGKNSDLKVIDPDGRKSGQQLLNEFIEQLALDLPKFINASGKEKADTLLRIIGVGDQLKKLEMDYSTNYNERRAIGQIADQKAKFAAEMESYPDVPESPVSVSELIKQQQTILARNGENQRKRDNALHLQAERNTLAEKVNGLREELERYTKQLEQKDQEMTIAFKSAEALQDESTAELEASIRNVESINQKVMANEARQRAQAEAAEYREKYEALSAVLNGIQKAKLELLNGANLPLPGLSVEDGELTYNGQQWDNMSGSDQLKVATAIVRKINPECGFVLLDKLEQMDIDTLREFGAWLEAEGLQAIATRVSTGDECSIIISDGYAVGSTTAPAPAKTWKEGEF